MKIASVMVRVFFVMALGLGSIILGMVIGLKVVQDYQLVPKHKIINVQHAAPVTLPVKLIKGGGHSEGITLRTGSVYG